MVLFAEQVVRRNRWPHPNLTLLEPLLITSSLIGFQPFNVCQILSPSGSTLVTNQMRSRQYRSRQIRKLSQEPGRPGLVEAHAIDRGNYIDAKGRQSHLKHSARVCEIGFSQIVQRSAKFFQGLEHTRRVLGIRPYPNIQVLRRANVTMCSESVRANNEVFNALNVEFC